MNTNNSTAAKASPLGVVWMGLHNLKSGWRNIMKYKVQNIVSVLCLSVGIICFGITLYFTNAFWHDTVKYEFDSKFISSWGINSDRDGIAPNTIAFADSLQQLPSVKSVLFYQSIISKEFTFRGKNGKEQKLWWTISFISPDWLKENNFYSTITGEKIGTLKPGTVVVSKALGELLMIQNIDPIGARIADTHYAPISDVVISDTNMGSFDGICIVVEGAKNLHKSDIDILNTELHGLQVRLNDDADFEQFAKERKTIRPYEDIWESRISYSFIPLVLLGWMMLIFLGASVLIIGLSGFLKMQLQLFTLRSREMALRRCNGAQIRQLFWLYVAEIFIVAIITAIVTAIITYAFQSFIMPKIDLFSFSHIMYVNLNAIYRIIAEVLIATFIFAIALSWFSLRKVISKPLSETVGRSYAHKSAFTKTMQVAQYFVATLFLIAALLVTYALAELKANENIGLKQFELYNVIGQLCFLLVAVSILCIILTIYSSVSLETRGRQKEIAIRKVNGAKTKDIIRLFSRYYIHTMAIAFALVFILGLAIIVIVSAVDDNWPDFSAWRGIFLTYFASVLIVVLITALTAGYKIYKVAKTNAAEYLAPL